MPELSVTVLDVGWGDCILVDSIDDNGDRRFGLVDCNDFERQRTALPFVMRHFERLGIDWKNRQHNFECYVTMLMLNARTIVPLMGIIYRPEDPKETERAVALYRELQEDSLRRGYQQWRCGRLGWEALFRDSPDLLDLNTRIKEVFDPHHTIAPGKYGIH